MYNKTCIILFSLIVLFSIFDIWGTSMIIEGKYELELNPVIRYFMRYYGITIGMVIFKVLVLILLGLLTIRMATLRERKLMLGGLAALSITYSSVISMFGLVFLFS